MVEFDPTRGTTLLGSPAVRTALEASTVNVLVAYDTAHGTALVTSVRAFLEANGHWESAATELDVHPHTLRNRIAKAEQVLDVDLGDARVRAELLLAVVVPTPRVLRRPAHVAPCAACAEPARRWSG